MLLQLNRRVFSEHSGSSNDTGCTTFLVNNYFQKIFMVPRVDRKGHSLGIAPLITLIGIIFQDLRIWVEDVGSAIEMIHSPVGG